MSRFAPLRRSLTVRFVIAAFVPIFGAGVLVLQHLTVGTIDDIGARNLLLARAVRGQVEGALREPIVALQGLREMLPQILAQSPSCVETYLDAAVRATPMLESILLVGADGRVRAVGVGPSALASRGDLGGIDLAHQPFVRQAIDTGQPAWSETQLSLLSGGVSLSVCVPVDGGRVLLGSFDIRSLLEFTRHIPEGGAVAVSIVDRGGSIVAHPDPEVALRRIKVHHLEPVRLGLAGREVTMRGDFLGRDMLSSVTRIPDTGWLVIVSQDAAVAFHQPWVTGLTFLGALLVTVGLALLFALTQSQRIAGPLASLAEGARRVAAGGYEFAPPQSGSREVQELAESFRRMTDAVRDRESRLRESEEKYRLFVENAGDAIFVAQDGRLPFANQRAQELAGLSAEQLRTTPWVDLVHPDDRARIVEHDRALVAGQPVPQALTFRVVRPGGEQRWVQLSPVEFVWEGRPATLNFARDITAYKQLEAQALQAQKMEAVGTLAGGVAHDFNNLLQAIQGSAELALMPGREAAANRRTLEQIVRATERGADLTRQLLTFSRKVESRRRPLDLNREIRQVARMLEHTLPKMVRVELELDPRLCAVSADAGQVQQLLLNLAVNAGHAMRGEGVLRIATRSVDWCGGNDGHPEVLPGRYAAISVRDTGCGIDERDRARVFEPFFTTKGPGEGTGLGLAMVFGIVKAHDGHVWFDSGEGAGTTFEVLFPAVAEAVAEPAAETAAALPTKHAGRPPCVLVIDDEQVVREVGAELLGTSGYRVITAPDGETGLELYRERRAEIDVVLLDLIMPGMGGGRCLEELRGIDPSVKIVLTSGYSPEGGGLDLARHGADGRVGKPFGLRTLLGEIDRVLAARLAGDASP